jgi:DivIVA domain-containing protein
VDDLRPDDIVGYRFKQSLRGYAIDEVDQLLDRLADQVEHLIDENEDLRGQLKVAETQAAVTRETEATLQRTLVVAQQAAERNLADASAQADATLATATAEAERVRREAEELAAQLRSAAEEEAARVRADADQRATATLERAQQFARREVVAARARVEQAVARHAEVLTGVAHHRDALRTQLANLEELALDPAPTVRSELVVGELPDGQSTSAGEVGDVAEHGAQDAVPEPPAPLTVRVHEGGGGDPWSENAPLGSDARDDG